MVLVARRTSCGQAWDGTCSELGLGQVVLALHSPPWHLLTLQDYPAQAL